MAGHSLGEQDPLDRTAEHFFAEGEAHEARGWDDVLPPDDDLDDEHELRHRRGPIDKIPRRRSAVIAVVALCVCLGAGVVAGGFAIFAKERFGYTMARIRSWLSLTSREPTTLRAPNPTAPATPPRDDTAPLAPAPAPIQAPPQAAAAPPAPQASPIPASGPPPSDTPRPAPPPPDIEGQERLRRDAIATRKRRLQSQPNYIWSPKLNALVPLSSMPNLEEPPAPPAPAPGSPRAGEPPR